MGLIVNPDMEDHRKIMVAPHTIPQVQRAEAFYDTDCGRVRVSWEKLGKNSAGQNMTSGVERVADDVVIKIEMPKGVHGELFWEGQSYKLQEGKNQMNLIIHS